ncbi:Uncharacterised protein [Vibrio cholerae]|nr:Uncharacterised protein [Vibrio cholerae]CSI82557.1 Uncharacterised protein [Vibrio cholerae]
MRARFQTFQRFFHVVLYVFFQDTVLTARAFDFG